MHMQLLGESYAYTLLCIRFTACGFILSTLPVGNDQINTFNQYTPHASNAYYASMMRYYLSTRLDVIHASKGGPWDQTKVLN